jgi:hypothetical protein
MMCTCTHAHTQLLDLELWVPGLLSGLNLSPSWVEAASGGASLRELDDVQDSRAVLRRGALLLEASNTGAGAEYRLAVAGLPLDELEAGSLRGVLSSAALEADLEARQGRAGQG